MNSPIKYPGGKSYLADWIISKFPERDKWHLYREPYFGSGAVLFHNNPEGISEAVNDVDRGLTDFWEVLAKCPDRLLRELWATPFSEAVWNAACQRMFDGDKVRRATAFFIKVRQSRQGLQKCFATPTARVRRGMNENVSAWLSAIDGLPEVHNRLKRVEICNLDALDFINRYDDEKALFYCDCPYLHIDIDGTPIRTAHKLYENEMTIEQHIEMLECLSQIKGMFLLSGYPNKLYSSYAEKYGWNIATKDIANHSSSKSTKRTMKETLWMNY